jgi:hypothetical protein
MNNRIQGYSDSVILTGAGTGAQNSGVTRFASVASAGLQTTESNARFYFRKSGVLRNLSWYAAVYSLDAGAVITVRINGSDSSITTTINAAGEFSDTTNTINVNEGDYMTIRFDSTGSSSGSVSNQIWSIELN